MATPVPLSLDAADIDNLRKAKYVAAGIVEYFGRGDPDFVKVTISFNVYQVKKKSLCFVRLAADAHVWDERADTWKEAIQQLYDRLTSDVAERIREIEIDVVRKQEEVNALENRLSRLRRLI